MEANWERVLRSIDQATNDLGNATTEEQFQAIGLLCRETIITLAQAVYDPVLHSSTDEVLPSKTDAKRMLEAYLKQELKGSSHESARKFARSALDLANSLQHRRTASFRDAALCVEATHAVVRVVALISGQLELSSQERPIRKVQELMPELIAEMRKDIAQYPLIREFFIVSKSWIMNYGSPCFEYYFEDHENLEGKVQILENYGFIIDVTPRNAKKYRMMEDFVDFLLADEGR